MFFLQWIHLYHTTQNPDISPYRISLKFRLVREAYI
jgi:hypothetical protein